MSVEKNDIEEISRAVQIGLEASRLKRWGPAQAILTAIGTIVAILVPVLTITVMLTNRLAERPTTQEVNRIVARNREASLDSFELKLTKYAILPMYSVLNALAVKAGIPPPEISRVEDLLKEKYDVDSDRLKSIEMAMLAVLDSNQVGESQIVPELYYLFAKHSASVSDFTKVRSFGQRYLAFYKEHPNLKRDKKKDDEIRTFLAFASK